MSHRESQSRCTQALRSLALICVLAITVVAGQAHAQDSFVWEGEPVHPACVHALAMHQGDALPVTAAVSLRGCSASERSKSKVRYEDEFATFEDDAILGGGSFGYRELTQLDNGILGLVIRRVLPDGEERVSLAAVKMVRRPMIRHGQIIQVQLVELLGELWIPDMQMLGFRSMGNVVRYSTGTGRGAVERTVDFTRLGRMRK